MSKLRVPTGWSPRLLGYEPGDGMNHNPEVEAWLEERNHPLDDALRVARDAILSADDRITECIKWKTPTFVFEGNIVSFSPSKNVVSLMFHRGAEIPGDHPRLEGDARLVRTMRFADADEVREGSEELTLAIQAWCASKQRS